MINNALFWKFIKFCVVGGSGVFVDFGVTWLAKEKMRLNAYLANSIGFSAAVISNYLLNRAWTFHSNDPAVALQFGKFALASSVGLALNNGIIFLLTGRLRLNFYVAKLIATGIVMIWNFWANYTFTFKQ